MPYYKAQHEVFIRAVIRHGDQLAAYRQAYPKASKQSAYTAAIRLMRQPHIQARVAVAMVQHAQQEHQRAQEREERKQRMAEEDTLQKRRWLARVVRGEVQKQRYMQFRGRTILVHETLNPFIILAAIELDTRYEYGTNPKIILDRQFARLYERAMRPIGESWLIKLNGAKTGTEKNTQNVSKKLTDSNVNRRPVKHLASNIPAVCNKVEEMVAQSSAALVHRATVFPAQYTNISHTATKAVISNGVQPSGTQREISREHAMGDTAASQEISRDARNDERYCATSYIAALQEISPDGRNDERYCATSDTAASQEISRDARNDDCYFALRKTGMSNAGVRKIAERSGRIENSQ